RPRGLLHRAAAGRDQPEPDRLDPPARAVDLLHRHAAAVAARGQAAPRRGPALRVTVAANARQRTALVALVARRLLVREGRPRPGGRVVLLASAAVAVGGTAATLLGVREPWPALAAGAAVLVLLGLLCARRLMPA